MKRADVSIIGSLRSRERNTGEAGNPAAVWIGMACNVLITEIRR